jgi:hypothetical protein
VDRRRRRGLDGESEEPIGNEVTEVLEHDEVAWTDSNDIIIYGKIDILKRMIGVGAGSP